MLILVSIFRNRNAISEFDNMVKVGKVGKVGKFKNK